MSLAGIRNAKDRERRPSTDFYRGATRQSTSGKCSRWVWLDIRWETSQMNNTEEPNESETASTEANQPARRRSRRATRPVMAPDAVETADPAADSAAPNTEAPAPKATKGTRVRTRTRQNT